MLQSVIQSISIVVVAMGIGIEIYYKADLGYVLISIGSLAFGLATKVEAARYKKMAGAGLDNPEFRRRLDRFLRKGRN